MRGKNRREKPAKPGKMDRAAKKVAKAAQSKGKKPGRLKKVLFIGLPIVMLLSGGAAAVMLGLIKIPGLKLPFGKPATVASKAKPPAKSTKKPAKKTVKPKPAVKPTPKPVKTPPPAVVVAAKPAPPTTDPVQGIKKVAKLWNGLDAAQLMPIVKDWKDPELAKVLTKMDADKVAELLAALPPKRASTLSRAIQREASNLPKPPTT